MSTSLPALPSVFRQQTKMSKTHREAMVNAMRKITRELYALRSAMQVPEKEPWRLQYQRVHTGKKMKSVRQQYQTDFFPPISEETEWPTPWSARTRDTMLGDLDLARIDDYIDAIEFMQIGLERRLEKASRDAELRAGKWIVEEPLTSVRSLIIPRLDRGSRLRNIVCA